MFITLPSGYFTVFLVDRFVRWNVLHLVTSFWTAFLMIFQYKCWEIILPFDPVSRMKEILMIPLHYIFLEFLWNGYFIFVGYKIYRIPASMKRTLLTFFTVKFFHCEGYSHLHQSIVLNDSGNVPSGISLVSLSSNIVSIVYADSCVVS